MSVDVASTQSLLEFYLSLGYFSDLRRSMVAGGHSTGEIDIPALVSFLQSDQEPATVVGPPTVSLPPAPDSRGSALVSISSTNDNGLENDRLSLTLSCNSTICGSIYEGTNYLSDSTEYASASQSPGGNDELSNYVLASEAAAGGFGLSADASRLIEDDPERIIEFSDSILGFDSDQDASTVARQFASALSGGIGTIDSIARKREGRPKSLRTLITKVWDKSRKLFKSKKCEVPIKEPHRLRAHLDDNECLSNDNMTPLSLVNRKNDRVLRDKRVNMDLYDLVWGLPKRASQAVDSDADLTDMTVLSPPN
uniref:ARAD1D40634p n=1 Tax=Blastobotrys adeninivorans TaxID=409370 RepID=A0A060TCC7_BLAAD